MPDLTKPSQIKQLFQANNLSLKKHLGQNFLINKGILEKIIKAAELKPSDTVVEIGPGIGTLTQELLKYAKNVIAIEKDNSLIPIVASLTKKTSRTTAPPSVIPDQKPSVIPDRKQSAYESESIQLIHQDALEYSPPSTPYKLVANIPYYITSPIINHFLKNQYLSSKPNPPQLIVLLIQKEVADKICAHNKMNVLALNVQTFGKPEIITKVSPGSFYPKPKVDSAILKITPYEKPLLPCDLKHYFALIHAGFRSKRKNLLNTLSHNLKIDKKTIEKTLIQSKINPKQRAETLTIHDWKRLTTLLRNL